MSPVPLPRARVRLGLIGDNIAASRSPDLHRIAGLLCGLDVSYDLLIPRETGTDFDALFDQCARGDLRGVNVTYPYKERVSSRILVEDPQMRRIGSLNTVVFGPDGPKGFNTDYTGFIAAYRQAFVDAAPGRVAMIGAGGVGRAIAFALASLGASEILIVDQDGAKAALLAEAVREAGQGGVTAAAARDVAEAVKGADGIVNCTPIGMVGRPGTVVPAALLTGARWGFDAVYTPVETQLKVEAEAAGLNFLSGYELFFHQGVEAFRIFTGRAPTDLDELRRRLKAAEPRQSRPRVEP